MIFLHWFWDMIILLIIWLRILWGTDWPYSGLGYNGYTLRGLWYTSVCIASAFIVYTAGKEKSSYTNR